jgi:hypothetical protein
MCTCARPSPPVAASSNDLYRFSTGGNTWTALSTDGSRPSLRYYMGFTATPNGMLYVFGGFRSSGKEGKKGRGAGGGAVLRWTGLVAWDAVMRRSCAAPLLSLSSFEEGCI